MGESMHPELLPWYAAGSVTPEEAGEIAAHLESCESCRKELEDLRSLGATLQAEAALAPEVFGAGEQRASWLRGSGMAPWLLAAAMLIFGLVVGIVGSRMVDGTAPGQALQPIEVATLTPATRGDDGVEKLRGAGPWALTILLPGTAPAGGYEMWLEAEDGSEVGDSPIAVDSDANGKIRVHLESLPADIYTVVLRSQDPEDGMTFRYALQIQQASD